MNKQIRWLLSEVERWTAEGIVTPEQAARLRARYPTEAPGVSWGLIVFCGIGAAVIGLGVILLFAYNWDEIPKFGKLALILGLVVAAHAAGLVLRHRGGWAARVGEALSLLGSMSFGAGIWLVAQIYNIDEHFPNGFLFWGLGALALAWVLESVPQALLATVALTIWGGAECFAFRAPVHWALPIVAAGVGVLALRQRSPVLTATALAALYVLVPTHAGFWAGSGAVFTEVLALSVLLVAAAKLAPPANPLAAVTRFFGMTGFLLCAYALSFHDTVRHLLRWSPDIDRDWGLVLAYGWLLAALATAAWGVVAWRAWQGARDLVRLEEWLIPIALIYCQGLTVSGYYHEEVLVAAVFNLACLGVAVMWMVRGCREARLAPTVLGSLLLALVVFARYFDLFDSMAARGLAFIVVGAGLFAEGFFYRRARREQSEGRAAP